jgi:hypothetical protein
MGKPANRQVIARALKRGLFGLVPCVFLLALGATFGEIAFRKCAGINQKAVPNPSAESAEDVVPVNDDHFLFLPRVA